MLCNLIFLDLLVLLNLVGLLFWAITYLYFWNVRYDHPQAKYQTFECGFISLHTSIITVKLNNILSATLLLLYEFEILLFIPLLLQPLPSYLNISLMTILLAFVIATVSLDLIKQNIRWEY